jgi:hypothetical protein
MTLRRVGAALLAFAAVLVVEARPAHAAAVPVGGIMLNSVPDFVPAKPDDPTSGTPVSGKVSSQNGLASILGSSVEIAVDPGVNSGPVVVAPFDPDTGLFNATVRLGEAPGHTIRARLVGPADNSVLTPTVSTGLDLTGFTPASVAARRKHTTFTVVIEGQGSVLVGNTILHPESWCVSASCPVTTEDPGTIRLTATPIGSPFRGWGGACSGTALTCNANVEGATTVIARYGSDVPALHTLRVITEGSGAGRVTSTDAAIDCPGICSDSVESNKDVTVAAVAATGSKFSGWSGPCNDMAPTCTVAMSSDRIVHARFDQIGVDLVTLTIDRSDTRLRVTSVPPGIDCGSTCVFAFARSTGVHLSASAPPGIRFQWSGACAGNGDCDLTLDVGALASLRVVRDDNNGGGGGGGGGGGSECRNVMLCAVPNGLPHFEDIVNLWPWFLLLVFLIAFPAALFDSTLEENYEVATAPIDRLALLRWFRRSVRHTPQPLAAALFVLSASLALMLAEPELHRADILPGAIGFGLAIIAVVFAFAIPTLIENRHRLRDLRLKLLPGGLVVALACALASRAFRLSPPYVYGIIAAISLRVEPAIDPRSDDLEVIETQARDATATALSLTVTTIIAWCAWTVLYGREIRVDAAFGAVIGGHVFGGLFVACFEAMLIQFLPMTFLKGIWLWKWNKRLWFAVELTALALLVAVMAAPDPGHMDPSFTIDDHIAFVAAVAFLVFACASYAFWSYYRWMPGRLPRADAATQRAVTMASRRS